MGAGLTAATGCRLIATKARADVDQMWTKGDADVIEFESVTSACEEEDAEPNPDQMELFRRRDNPAVSSPP